MKRIIITERDLTSNVEVLSSYDVAYVPGFTDQASAQTYYHKPTLFTNKFEFQKAMGYAPAVFQEDQKYPVADKKTKKEGFSKSAIPSSGVMFEAGDSDLGYRIALYLLSLGLPVYYEVMNSNNSEISVENMYKGLAFRFIEDSDSSFDTPGDYAVKFLTTGGYPVFEYGSASEPVITTTEDLPLTASNWSAETHTITFTTEQTPDEASGVVIKNKGTDITNKFEVTFDINGKTITATQQTEPGGSYTEYTITDLTISYSYAGSPTGDVAMSIMSGMLNLAHSRGDVIALIDHTNNPERKLTVSDTDSVISVMRSQCVNVENLDYGAMFTPWYECSSDRIVENSKSNFVPGSVGYLSSLAVQLRDYSPWLAVSGVTRGKVPNLTKTHTQDLLTNNIADSYQTIPGESAESLNLVQMSINPITYVRNVGYCIWGNRTLRNNSDGTTALSFLNIRSAVTDVKKAIYESSQNMLFEQNTDVTWIKFKDKITPLLDRMVSNFVLQTYSIIRYTVDPESGNPVPAYKVLGVIKIQPINSIEVFDLTVQLENASIATSEL